jgi:hypothetical protein
MAMVLFDDSHSQRLDRIFAEANLSPLIARRGPGARLRLPLYDRCSEGNRPKLQELPQLFPQLDESFASEQREGRRLQAALETVRDVVKPKELAEELLHDLRTAGGDVSGIVRIIEHGLGCFEATEAAQARAEGAERELSLERELLCDEMDRLKGMHAEEMGNARAEIERLKVAVHEGDRERRVLELRIEDLTRERDDALRDSVWRQPMNRSPIQMRMMRRTKEVRRLRARLQTSSALEARSANAAARREARRRDECGEPMADSVELGDVRVPFEPLRDARTNVERPLHGERWKWQWMQLAFLAIRLSAGAYMVMRRCFRLGESGIRMPSVRTVQRRMAGVRGEMVATITSVDLIGDLSRHVREEYGIPANDPVLINLAKDASYTTADGHATPGPNHGIFTWFAMPLNVRMRTFVVHVCQTENARVDAMVRGRNGQIIQALRGGGCRLEVESTDGDSGTTAAHLAQHVQQWTAREKLALLGSERGLGASLFDKVRLLRALGVFDEVRWAADFLHWARTVRNRVLDRGHVIVRVPGGEPICRDEIVGRMPAAPGVDGPGLDSAESKFQDAPPIAMNSLHSLVWAMSAFPEYARFISIGVVIQAALRLTWLSRSARMLCLEMADAMITFWMIYDPIASAKLAQFFRKSDDRAMAFYSHDQLIRAASLIFVMAQQLEIHADVAIDTCRLGTKPLEEHFGTTRQGARGDDRDSRWLHFVADAQLQGQFEAAYRRANTRVALLLTVSASLLVMVRATSSWV